MAADRQIVIIGGGIVGLATAYRLCVRHPGWRISIVEKESALAQHQTGHNSGVIHTGIYYRPGSAKARTSVIGAKMLRELCLESGIKHEVCGKIVVATDDRDLGALEELYRRGSANGVEGLALVGPERLKELEPHAAGIRALHVPGAAIVDYSQVARSLAARIAEHGGDIRLGTRVLGIRRERAGVILETSAGEVSGSYLIACAGLHSDRMARLGGCDPGVRIVPFRGEYYELRPERCDLVRGLIYPVPDPRFPFLGVHFTRSVHGGVEVGPNAVLALHREGYTKRRFSLRDVADTVGYSGFWRMAAKYWRTGAQEMVRSFSKRAFARALARLVPEVTDRDLVPAPAGVRAQALSPAGDLLDDFLIVEGPRSLHVCNAPSPAATASLAIGDEIVRRAEERFTDLPA